MNTTRALAWNTGVQIFGKVISTAIGVIIVGIMTRYLGREGFGMYSTANAFLQVFAILLDLGLNVMVVQMLGERAGDRAYENRVVSATFTLRTISAIGILSLAPIIGLFLPYPRELRFALFALWGSFFFSAINQIVIGVQQRHLKMHIVAISEVAGRFTLLGGLLIARAAQWGLVPIVLIVSLGGCINFAMNTFIAKRYASFVWNWDPAFWRILLRRSWPIGVSIVFNLIYFKADTLILSYVRPFSEVGIYGAAYRVLEILITIPFMYTGVLLPLIARAWTTKNTAGFQSLLRHSYVAMAIFVLPMLTGIFVLGENMMTLLAGRDFAASGDILKILMLAVTAIFFGTVSSHAIVALDAQRRVMPLYIAVAILTLIGYLLFIPTYGIWAAAWLTVFSEGLIALGTTVISIKISRTTLDWSPLLKTTAAACVMGIAIWPLKEASLPISILTGALVYALFLLCTGTVSRATLQEIFALRRGIPTADVT